MNPRIKSILLFACLAIATLPIGSTDSNARPSSTAKADDTALAETENSEEIRLKARAQEAPSDAETLDRWRYVGIFLMVLLGWALINAVWSAPPGSALGSLRRVGRPERANDLFLKVDVRDARTSSGRLALRDIYVRSLDRRHARLVTRQAVPKGTRLILDLGSLPGFPEGEHLVRATVTRSHRIGTTWNEFKVHLEDESSDESAAIDRYVESMTRHRRPA